MLVESKREQKTIIKNPSEKFRQNSTICSWQAGRTEALKNMIIAGNKGKKSFFCKEYKKVKAEMIKNKCRHTEKLEMCN